MSYAFRQILIPSTKYSIKSPYIMFPQFITVHNTANDAPAVNEISFLHSNNNQVSYHVAIDDKEVIQAIPFNRNAWHCGDGGGDKDPNALKKGNRVSIGIEICYSKNGGARYAIAEENAVQYIASLLKQYGWGIERVKKHQDWSGKYCPHRILAEDRWNSFLKRIEEAMKPKESGQKEGNELAQELLNETGRASCKEMIKRGVEEKLFSSKHENVDKYTDKELISYAMAYTNRKTK